MFNFRGVRKCKFWEFFTALWTFFNSPSLELYWWSFLDRDMDWRMCPSTSWQRHAKLRQETRLIRKRDGISCDHSGASTHSLSHGLITHIALPWRSPSMILSVKVHSWAKRHISPCKGNDYQHTAKEACRHLHMGRMRRHWGEWYSHCYAPMFPARMADNRIFL